jgi:hypothetical protein
MAAPLLQAEIDFAVRTVQGGERASKRNWWTA